ncbi:MAG: DNA topoisomerase, partial [Candidatus Nanohaloarchaea archaeon]
MKTTVMVGEKPKVASRIAQALGDYSIRENRGVKNYVIDTEEGEVIIAPAVGHIFNLEQVQDEWTYPVFELEWKPIFETEDDAGYVKKYYRNLKEQLEKADEYINACDYDLEGSVIGGTVIQQLENPSEDRIKRMKFSTLTTSDLREAYDDLDGFDREMTQAGITRHILDFYYGINVSRALMQAVRENNRYKTLSTGRVQGPTLKLLADREREIQEFEPDPYWELYLIHSEFEAQWEDEEDRIWEEERAEETFGQVRDQQTAEVTHIKKNDYKHGAPIPFNLTGLQS